LSNELAFFLFESNLTKVILPLKKVKSTRGSQNYMELRV